MEGASGGLRLAAEFETGAGAGLVVLILALASCGIFVMLSRSLRRMRTNVANGEFEARVEASGAKAPAADAGARGGAAAKAGAAAVTGAKGSEKLPRQRSRQGTGKGSEPDQP